MYAQRAATAGLEEAITIPSSPVRGSAASSESVIGWEETYNAAWAVAAPARDDEGHALGAFGVAAPIARHSRAGEKGNRDAVIDVAARAASALRLGQRPEHG
jgi:hypothetical protein